MRLAIGVVRPCNPPVSKHMAIEHSATNHVAKHGAKRLRLTNSWNSLGSDSGKCRTATRISKLGDRWKEYQGIKNWEGLLDPLDDDLRSEILRYGQFVEAAYRCFDFDTSSQTYAKSRFPRNSMLAQCGLGKSGYRVTKNLRATCGVQLPRWVNDKASSWILANSNWIGYVAVCNDKDEIARLGRRDVVIAFRGTATCLEWIENLRATLTCLPHDMGHQTREPMVESGFLSMYTSSTTNGPSLRDMVKEEIAKISNMYNDEPLSVTITGHSLGAALATLTAYDLTATCDPRLLVTVVSFGGPRVGNGSFRCQLERSGTRILRIVNSDDLITKMPGFVANSHDVANKRDVHVRGLPSWLQKRVEDTQWVYADVGKEFRLSSSHSPYLSNGNLATCHDLKTYLHLVNGFVSSTCPFRATARRVLSSTQSKEQVYA
ncbi:hypothetical protein RJ639_004593 [Escallonia herrerae]|uniref:Fungal lipase-type domain-containing protein n=1 Tax=Escallonia herrerae TaxID=1293975 RepID=A0AA88W2K0_9ASTE|nr:hypothetical protein RJ639_004593 [Escallonia herrerae]